MSLLRPIATVRRRAGARLVPLAAALLAATSLASAAPLAAQSRPIFRWNGDVDREVLLVVRGRDVDVRDEGGRSRVRVASALPRTQGTLDVRMEEGRGRVDVVQQPSARNDWTGIVRVRDERGGADRYRLVAHWVPSRGGWDGGWQRGDDDDDRPGRGVGRGRDGWPDRDGDGDRDRDDRRDRGGWGRARTGEVRWTGLVDDVVEIRIQGDRVDQLTRRGTLVRDVRTDVRGGGLPARDDVTVRVREQRQGRGRVAVLEQPSARNGYTAVLRVTDPDGGADRYDFVVGW